MSMSSWQPINWLEVTLKESAEREEDQGSKKKHAEISFPKFYMNLSPFFFFFCLCQEMRTQYQQRNECVAFALTVKSTIVPETKKWSHSETQIHTRLCSQ